MAPSPDAATDNGGPSNGAGDESRAMAFKQFQHSYLRAMLCGAGSDWLKGPYMYRIYEARGFEKQDITILFTAGYVSSAFFGLVAGMMSDAFGRRMMCLCFTLLYAIHCAMHISSNFFVLLLARAVSGVATALLFSSFEAWMVAEHTKRFPEFDLAETFAIQTQSNAVVAVVAGLVAQAGAEVGGYSAPFFLAVPLLGYCAYEVSRWPENVGSKQQDVFGVASAAFANLDSVILRVGVLQCLFEGSMHVFVFLWTPCLQRGGTKVHHGLVFAVYMLAMMMGGRQSKPKCPYRLPLGIVFAIAACCLMVPSISQHFWLDLTAFCGFEWCVGCYFPQIAMLRSKYLHEKTRSATITLFRVPFNCIVVAVLIWGRTLPPHVMLSCASCVLLLSACFYYTLPEHTEGAVKTGKAE